MNLLDSLLRQVGEENNILLEFAEGNYFAHLMIKGNSVISGQSKYSHGEAMRDMEEKLIHWMSQRILETKNEDLQHSFATREAEEVAETAASLAKETSAKAEVITKKLNKIGTHVGRVGWGVIPNPPKY